MYNLTKTYQFIQNAKDLFFSILGESYCGVKGMFNLGSGGRCCLFASFFGVFLLLPPIIQFSGE